MITSSVGVGSRESGIRSQEPEDLDTSSDGEPGYFVRLRPFSSFIHLNLLWAQIVTLLIVRRNNENLETILTSLGDVFFRFRAPDSPDF